jgi:hypothetical protein
MLQLIRVIYKYGAAVGPFAFDFSK